MTASIEELGGGEAVVLLSMECPAFAPLQLPVRVEWRPGQERADFEATAIEVASLLFATLPVEPEGARISRGLLGD